MQKLIKELSYESRYKLTRGFGFDENKDIDQLNENGGALAGFWCYTPLMYAAVCGDLALTKELVENGAILDKIDDFFGSTALMWAAKYGHDKIVAYLLEKNADLTCKTKIHTSVGEEDVDALSLAKKSSCCSLYGFWQRAKEIAGYADYNRTRTLLEQAHKNR